MQKTLRRKWTRLYHYENELDRINDRDRILGPHKNMSGHFDEVSGDCTRVSGFFEKGIAGCVSKMMGSANGKVGLIDTSFHGYWGNIFGDISKMKGIVRVFLYGHVSRDLCFDDCTGWKGNCSKYFGYVPILVGEDREKGRDLEDAVIDDCEEGD